MTILDQAEAIVAEFREKHLHAGWNVARLEPRGIEFVPASDGDLVLIIIRILDRMAKEEETRNLLDSPPPVP